MACSKCGKNKDRYQVVKEGRILFQSANQSTAEAVARRYEGSEVKPKSQS